MDLRETLEAAIEELGAAHEKNRVAYRAALEARKEADERVRETCDVASVSANDLGAAKKALDELNRTAPVVEASGEVGG